MRKILFIASASFILIIIMMINNSPLLLAESKLSQALSTDGERIRPGQTTQPTSKPQGPSTDQLSAPFQAQIETLEKNMVVLKDSIGDTRTLIYVIISIQFAIIVAFLGLAWWLEQKTQKLVNTVDRKVVDAKSEIDSHLAATFSGFQTKIDEACQVLSQARASHDLLMSGKVLFWTGKPEKALEILNAALAFDDQNPEVRKFRGLCLRQMGDEYLVEAIADLEAASSSQIFNNDASLFLDLGRAYFGAKHWAKAIDYARKAEINGHPSKEETQLLIADSLVCERKFDEALSLYDKMIAENPRSTIAINHKAGILYGRAEFDKIIALYEEAIYHRAHVTKYHIFLANTYAERGLPGDWEKALQQFDEAEHISSTDWDLWYYKGRAYLQRHLRLSRSKGTSSDDLTNAEKCFRHGETISKKAGAPRFINQISRLYLLSGQIDKAVAEAKRSVDMNRKYIQNHLTLCTALLADKRWPDAVSAAQDSLECSTNKPGKIWSLFFLVLAKSLQRYDLQSLSKDLSELAQEIDTARYFDTRGWDWSTTQEVIAEEIVRLSPRVKDMLAKLVEAMTDPTKALEFEAKLAS